ncbi:hypothetical protein PBI_SCTP2_334 [Salicola phage SCTP-2]|nr:hypothetical protein PBI_SCTP2_334 [Salicola phage SCTP-2]
MTESITIEAKNKKHQSDILGYFNDIGECFPQFNHMFECSLDYRNHPYTPKKLCYHPVHISFNICADYELVRLLHNSVKYVSQQNGTRLYYDEEEIDWVYPISTVGRDKNDLHVEVLKISPTISLVENNEVIDGNHRVRLAKEKRFRINICLCSI